MKCIQLTYQEDVYIMNVKQSSMYANIVYEYAVCACLVSIFTMVLYIFSLDVYDVVICRTFVLKCQMFTGYEYLLNTCFIF